MKKLVSYLFLMALLVSVTALVGCNGLWGFDDDDDVIAPPGTKFSFAGSVDIPGDGIGASNLKAATTLGDGLKAQVWKKVAGKADEMVHEADVDKADGKYTLDFYGSAAYYFIKIVKPNDTLFKMLFVLGTVDEKSATKTDVAVTPKTTAIGILMEKEASIEEPSTFATAKATDIAALEAVLTTSAAFDNLDTTLATVEFPITGFSLNKTTAALFVGGANETLTVTLTPAYASAASILWESTVSAVATVVQTTGVVSPVAAGVATITCTVTDKKGNIFKKECSITVTKPVISVSLDQNNLNLFKGNTSTLIATINPQDATNLTLTWESSNKAVADVDATGKVTAYEVGEATITVKTADGNKTATCLVKVAAIPVDVTSVTLSDVTMTAGDAAQSLVPVFNAGANTMTNYAWLSSEPTVATVEETSGKVTPLKAGFTTITLTVTTANVNDPKVFTATCKVTVNAAPLLPKTKVSLNLPVSHNTDTSLMVALGETWIQIANVSKDLTPTVTLKDVKGNTILLGKDADLTSQTGILTLIGQTVNGIPLDAESGDPFKKYASFQEITFSVAIPGEATVSVVKFDGKNALPLATEVK